MDLGVGSFVFSQGVVSALPMIKDPQYLRAPLRSRLFTTTRKCLPLLILGVLRTLSVKGTDYPVNAIIFLSNLYLFLIYYIFEHSGTPNGVWDALELFLYHRLDTYSAGFPASTNHSFADFTLGSYPVSL